jgi:hypothetical protein
MKLWPILILTIGLTAWIGYSFVSLERDTVMKNWDTLRCNPLMMFAAPFVKPDADPRTESKFAGDNFSYCIKTAAQSALAVALAPFTALFGQQLSVGEMFGQIMNGLRAFIKALYDAFLSFIEPFLKRFMAVTYQAGIVTQHLRSAFQRVNAVMVSFIFIGLSAFQGLQNFIDTVINIILIICGIMLAIIIILFFILFPFIPLIITVLTLIAAVAVGSAASVAADMKGGFCFSPETQILLKSGESKPISELRVGDELDPVAGTVEGILVLEATSTPLYDLEGIHVSGTHLVQDEEGGWRSVATDRRAVRLHTTMPRLYCLNTTRRIIPVRSPVTKSVQLFRDWEEIDDDDVEGQQGWDLLIRSMLGMKAPTDPNNTFCLMSPATLLRTTRADSLVRLEEIVLGDFVEYAPNQFTRVLGLVEGRIGCAATPSEPWIAACIQWKGGEWTRSTTLAPGESMCTGRHLITESGTFLTNQGLVRDFTEVGYDRIHETYPFVASRLDSATKQK